jgi:hypothetical protein
VKPAVAAGRPADAALTALAMAALRKAPAYVDAQAAYDAKRSARDPMRWENFELKGGPPRRLDAHVFPHPSGTIVMLSVSAGGTGCGYDFAANLGGAAWKLEGGRLLPLRAPRSPREFFIMPRSVVDIDGDGNIDFVFDEKLLRIGADGNERWDALTVTNLDTTCGC